MRRWLWPTVLGVAVLLFSWWFLTPQLVTKGPGDDMFFHMNRIMSIWEGWREGQFPVRVYGRQLDGFGVPEGLFYPDVNLWLPALLYGAGVPIVTVYHLYWLGVTALAVFGGWFAFSRWTGSAVGGALAAVLYQGVFVTQLLVLSSPGSAFASACLPLAFFALFALLRREGGEGYWPLLVLAGAGVLLSHLISALLFVGMALCFVAVSWRQLAASAVRRRALVLAAVFTALGCAWWYVPFLRLYGALDFSIKAGGMTPSLHGMTNGAGELALAGFWWGWPLVALALVCLARHHDVRRDRYWLLCFAGCAVLSLGCSTVFPWQALEGLPFLHWLSKLQFPIRFLLPFAVFPALFVGRYLGEMLRGRQVAAAVLCLLVAGLSAWPASHMHAWIGPFDMRWTAAREAAPRELPTSGPLVYPHGVDYLYRGVDAAAVRASFGTPAVPQVSGRDVRLSGWRQRGTRFSFAVSAPDGAVVRLPLFFYPGYAARDEAGREVAVREGRDHLVEVVLPPGGTAVFGRYAGRPWFLWLDVLAVASWGAFAWSCWRRRRAGGSQGAF